MSRLRGMRKGATGKSRMSTFERRPAHIAYLLSIVLCGLPFTLATDHECTGTLNCADFEGDYNIVVPPGAECTLRNLNTEGKLTVGAGASVTVSNDDETSYVGAVECTGCEGIVLQRAVVKGSVELENHMSLEIHDTQVQGAIELKCRSDAADGAFFAHNTEVQEKLLARGCKGAFEVEERSFMHKGMEVKGGSGPVRIMNSSMGDADTDGCVIIKERTGDITMKSTNIHGKLEVKEVIGDVILEDINSLLHGAIFCMNTGSVTFERVTSGMSGGSQGYMEFKMQIGNISIKDSSVYGSMLYEEVTGDIIFVECNVVDGLTAERNVGGILVRDSSFSGFVSIESHNLNHTMGGIFIEGSNFNDHTVSINDCPDAIIDILECEGLHLFIEHAGGVSVEYCLLEKLTITDSTMGYTVQHCTIEHQLHCSDNEISTETRFCNNTLLSGAASSGGQCRETHDPCPTDE